MEIQRYAELKASGDISLQLIEGKAFIIKKVYDPDTGQPKDPQVLAIDKDSFLHHKKDAQKRIDEMTLFLDDVDSLEKKVES